MVLAGGSDGAAWKAELLLACGAELHLYCEESELSECFKALVSTSQMLTWHDRSWGPDSFKGAELALADCETDEEAGRFYNAARSAGVPVNVIDKPEFCQFQFGSIVNRSPVVVSISTDGAAPILAQAIRRRIETLLPLALKDWGRLPRPSGSGSIYASRPARRGDHSGRNLSTGRLPKGWMRAAKKGC